MPARTGAYTFERKHLLIPSLCMRVRLVLGIPIHMFPFSLMHMHMASEAPNDWSTEKCTIIRSVILGLRLQLSTWAPLLFGSFGLFQQFSWTCGRSDIAITLATTLFLFPQNTR
jgi:hypothetical protein